MSDVETKSKREDGRRESRSRPVSRACLPATRRGGAFVSFRC